AGHQRDHTKRTAIINATVAAQNHANQGPQPSPNHGGSKARTAAMPNARSSNRSPARMVGPSLTIACSCVEIHTGYTLPQDRQGCKGHGNRRASPERDGGDLWGVAHIARY